MENNMKLTKTRLKQIILEELNEANLQGLVSNLERELYRSFEQGHSAPREAREAGTADAIQLVRSVAGRVRNNDGDPAFIKWLDDVIDEMEEIRASVVRPPAKS
jgi:hypothetical protein